MNLRVFKRFLRFLKWPTNSLIILKYLVDDFIGDVLTCEIIDRHKKKKKTHRWIETKIYNVISNFPLFSLKFILSLLSLFSLSLSFTKRLMFFLFLELGGGDSLSSLDDDTNSLSLSLSLSPLFKVCKTLSLDIFEINSMDKYTITI